MFDSSDEMRAAQAATDAKVEDRLTTFFYLLMRNELPTGVVAELVKEVEGCNGMTVYTAKGVAVYAKELAQRLLRVEKTQ